MTSSRFLLFVTCGMMAICPSICFHMQSTLTRRIVRPLHVRMVLGKDNPESTKQDIVQNAKWTFSGEEKSTKEGLSLFMITMMVAAPVWAKDGEYGILEGRTIALIHPVVMVGLLATSIYSAVLGFQYRRTRDLATEISQLKASLPILSSGEKASLPINNAISSIEEEVAKAKESNEPADKIQTLTKDLATLQSAKGIEEQINEKTETRKQLVKGNFRDKHYDTGAWILGLGIALAVGGPLDTYFRAGKLFPGPHLFAGAAMVVLWAVAASMIPSMQKGNNTARTTHITANVLNIGLFAWQLNTGWDIVLKVLKFTKFP